MLTIDKFSERIAFCFLNELRELADPSEHQRLESRR
jgi:hypothetical protein